MLRLSTILLITSVILFFTSCNKSEGEGGSGIVKGTIYVKEYDKDFKILQRVIPATEEDVYINFGSRAGIGENTNSSNNGTFLFDNLLSGTYTIYAYSDDTSKILDSKIAIEKKISVDNGDTKTIDSLIIYKGLDIDKGNATITGKLWLINYKSDGLFIKDISLAQDLDVFLVYNDHKAVDLDTKTGKDGVFQFTNLLKGSYTIYAYSEDLSGSTQMIPQITKIEITKDKQMVMMTDTLVKL